MSWIPRPLRVLGFRLGSASARWPVEPTELWVHGASMGEIAAAGSLLSRLGPDGPSVYLTSGTPEGLERAEQRGFGRRRGPGPMDRLSTRRLLRRLRPRALWLVESELWPGLLAAARDEDVPVGVVGARISRRSYGRYDSALGRTWFAMLGRHIARIATADSVTATRLVHLGIPEARVRHCGRIKIPARPDPDAPVAALMDRLSGGGRRWVVGGCTHTGEDEQLLRSAPWPLMLAPRHRQRLEQVEAIVQQHGLNPVRRSGNPDRLDPEEVLILDTVGELADAYTRARWTLVGGSVAGERGHDLLEPLAAGSRLLVGPRLEHQEDEAQRLRAGGWLFDFDGRFDMPMAGSVEPATLLSALDGRPATLTWMRGGGLL